MATTGGKSKKTKWKVVDATKIINPNAPRKLTSSSWADESNDVDDAYDGRKSLPTAPRAARGAENDANIPKEPPFQAYLSNLSYDVTEEDLTAFFANLRVKHVKLPRDDRGHTNRAKGFGYVEFEDRKSLVDALTMPDTNCKNRRMRIEVAENGDQGRGGRGGQRERGPNEPDRTLENWRSGPRSDAEPQSDRDGYRAGPRRDYGNDRGMGSGMFGDRDRRNGGFRDDDRDRMGFRNRDGFRDNRGGIRDDRGGFRDERGNGFRDERGGGFRDERGGGFREERGNGGFREERGNGGFRDERGGDGGFREERGNGGFREDRAGYRDGGGDRFERRVFDERRDDRGSFKRDDREGVSPSERIMEPKTRTRLNLQPRSRPVEGVEKPIVGETSTNSSSNEPVANSASIFGGARPVDTSAREREIEERLAKQRDDRPSPRDENRLTAPQRDVPPHYEDAPASPPPLEPAPPPKENVWAKRTQQTSHVNNGTISPHEDGDRHKPRETSPNKESNKYQPPRRNMQDDNKRDERNVTRSGGNSRGGGLRNADIRQAQPSKPRDQKKDISEDSIKMPKMQEHQAPNFIGSNKYAFLEDSDSVAE